MFIERDIYYPALNYFTRERIDPLLVYVCRVLGDASLNWYAPMQLVVMFWGCFALIRVLRLDSIRALGGAFLYTLGLWFVFGFDKFMLQAHWYPAFLGSVMFLGRSGSWLRSIFVAGAVSVIWIASAGALTFCGAAFALLTLLVLQTIEAEPKEKCQLSLKKHCFSCQAILCCVVMLSGLLSVPLYLVPEFPAKARLTPVTAFSFYEKPFIGAYISPNPMIFAPYVKLLGHFTLSFIMLSAVLSLVFLCCNRFSKQRQSGGSILGGIAVFLFTALIVGGEYFVPESSSPFAPFPVFARFIPGLAVAGLGWNLIALGYLLGLIILLRRDAALTCLWGVLALLLLLAVRPSPAIKLEHYPAVSSLTSGQSQEIRLAEIENSPSRMVVRYAGEWAAVEGAGELRSRKNLTLLKKNKDYKAAASASPLNEEAIYALDGKEKTRWRTGRPQAPGDYFSLSFAQPVEIIRVELSVSRSLNDFPRGIKVMAGASPEDLHEVINQPSWLGPVMWTSEGFPYFGKRGDVVLDFAQQEKVAYLKFIQIGSTEDADWSIAEVRLYRLP